MCGVPMTAGEQSRQKEQLICRAEKYSKIFNILKPKSSRLIVSTYQIKRGIELVAFVHFTM